MAGYMDVQPNIIPERTAAYLYVRAANTIRVEELMVKVENCINAAALATGCTVKMKWRDAGMCKSMCLYLYLVSDLYTLLYMMTTYSSNNNTKRIIALII